MFKELIFFVLFGRGLAGIELLGSEGELLVDLFLMVFVGLVENKRGGCPGFGRLDVGGEQGCVIEEILGESFRGGCFDE